MSYAARDPSSPFFQARGATVRPEDDDAGDHLVLNSGGDCIASLTRVPWRGAHRLTVLLRTCGLAEHWIVSFLEYVLSNNFGPYAGVIFWTGIYESVQDSTFEYSD